MSVEVGNLPVKGGPSVCRGGRSDLSVGVGHLLVGDLSVRGKYVLVRNPLSCCVRFYTCF